MGIKSKTFLIGKDENFLDISEYLYQEIGYDAYLVKSIQAESVNDYTTQITVLYEQYSTDIVESFSPKVGGIFTTGLVLGDFDARLVFEHPVDSSTLESGTFIVNSTELDTTDVTIPTGYNNYFAKLNLSGYTGESFHNIRFVSSKLARIDGSYYEYSLENGFVIHSQSAPYSGNVSKPHTSRRRGEIKLDIVKVSKGSDFQKVIAEALAVKGIDFSSLINFSIVKRADNVLDVFYLYISKLEPQIIEGSPLNFSLFPDATPPSFLSLIFSTELEPDQLVAESVFSIHSGFSTEEDIDPADISLSSDRKTVRIDLSNYITSARIYSIIAKVGLKSLQGFVKQKPEQWVVCIDSYEAGAGGTFTGELTGVTEAEFAAHTGNTTIHFTTGQINHNNIQNVGTYTHDDIDEHLINTFNPHSVTASQVGAPTTAQFTGHTGNYNNPHQVTASQVGSPTTALFTGHTGDTTIHFTQSQISITESQISDLQVYVLPDGSVPFTQPISGQTPTVAAHLATKEYVDSIGYDATYLRLDGANSLTNHMNAGGNRLTGLADPVGLQDAATAAWTIGSFTLAVVYDAHLTSDSHTGYLTTGRAHTWLTGDSAFTGHTGNTSIHFTEGSISHLNIQDIGSNSHAAIDSHISNTSNPHSVTASQVGAPSLATFTGHTGDSTIHFTTGQIDHNKIQNVGSYTHDDIDEHLINTFNPHSVTASQVGAPTTAQFTGHTGTSTIHFTVGSILHSAIQEIGVYSHDDIDSHIDNLSSNPHAVTASQVGAPTTADFTGHTGNSTLHVSLSNYQNWSAKHQDINWPVAFSNWTSVTVGSASRYVASQRYYTNIQIPEYVSFGTLDTNTAAVGDQGALTYVSNRSFHLDPGRGFEFHIYLSTISATTNVRYGFWGNDNSTFGTAQITGEPTYAVWLDYTKSESTYWRLCTNSGGSTTKVSTGITVSGDRIYVIGFAMNDSYGIDLYCPSESGSSIVCSSITNVISGAQPQQGTTFWSVYKDNSAGASRANAMLSRISILSNQDFNHGYMDI